MNSLEEVIEDVSLDIVGWAASMRAELEDHYSEPCSESQLFKARLDFHLFSIIVLQRSFAGSFQDAPKIISLMHEVTVRSLDKLYSQERTREIGFSSEGEFDAYASKAFAVHRDTYYELPIQSDGDGAESELGKMVSRTLGQDGHSAIIAHVESILASRLEELLAPIRDFHSLCETLAEAASGPRIDGPTSGSHECALSVLFSTEGHCAVLYESEGEIAEDYVDVLAMSNYLIRVVSNLNHQKNLANSAAKLLQDVPSAVVPHLVNGEPLPGPIARVMPSLVPLDPNRIPKKQFNTRLYTNSQGSRFDFSPKGFGIFGGNVDRLALASLLGVIRFFIERRDCDEAYAFLFAAAAASCGTVQLSDGIEMAGHEELAQVITSAAFQMLA